MSQSQSGERQPDGCAASWQSCEGASQQICMLQRNKITKKLKSSRVEIKLSQALCSAFGMCTRALHDINLEPSCNSTIYFLATSVSLCLCMRLEGHLSHSPAILRADNECALCWSLARLNYSGMLKRQQREPTA